MRRYFVSLPVAILVICGAVLLSIDVLGRSGASHPRDALAAISSAQFIASVDTMKLSKDQASGGFTSDDRQAADLAARMSVTHITADTPLENPAVLGAWAARIHADGKHVWFRLGSTDCNQPHGDLGDGYPTYQPGYLTELHNLMLAHPEYFASGDILDGDAEAENSCWWAAHYGCGVQAACTPCNANASNMPCAPISQFIAFLANMTTQENRDLASRGINGVATNIHSTDPGTATHILTPEFVRQMGDVITVDAYPDQNTTDPAAAAAAWLKALGAWHQAWLGRGIDVSVLVGEWGYSNAINVSDAAQQAVIQAEVRHAFSAIPYLLGMNYWVGPGAAGDGGYTQIFYHDLSGWHFRSAAAEVSEFFAGMTGRPGTSTTTTAPASTAPTTPSSPASGLPPTSTLSITNLRLAPVAFRTARVGPAVAPRGRYGTSISYWANRPGTSIFVVVQVTPGVRRGAACIAPPRHSPPALRRCKRVRTIGRFRYRGKTGANRLHFTGWVARRSLAPGQYVLRVMPASGGMPRQARFRILPSPGATR